MIRGRSARQNEQNFCHGSFWMDPAHSNSHRKFSFALKCGNARRGITKLAFFEDFRLRIEIWRSGGWEFKQNFDPDPFGAPRGRTDLQKPTKT